MKTKNTTSPNILQKLGNVLSTLAALLGLLFLMTFALLVGTDAYIDIPLETMLISASTAVGFGDETSTMIAHSIYPAVAPLFKFAFVFFVLASAFIIHRLAGNIAEFLFRSDNATWNFLINVPAGRSKSQKINQTLGTRFTPQREKTIKYLIASVISLSAFVAAIFLSFTQFFDVQSLVIFAGLFTAAFAFGARNLLGDLLSGVAIMFEDNFTVGEKVEIANAMCKIQGYVESINLRTTSIRSETGELFIVPNGELRILRNLSRGKFSVADIKLKILTTDLEQTLPLLRDLGQEADLLFPELLAPWQVIDEEGILGEHTTLALLIKTQYGQAADIRPRLLAMVKNRLNEAGIILSD
jgi:small conductance mechanosensitive channel